MSESSSPYKILLSVRSPILAPLYLAKVRGGAFRKLDFKYPFELSGDFGPAVRVNGKRLRPNDGHDALVQAVLSKSAANAMYIAGVADPFRALLNHTDSAMYRPKIIGGLIRHQSFWLATDDDDLKADLGLDAVKCLDYIFSQPRYTSGYAVLSQYLSEIGTPTTDEAIDNYTYEEKDRKETQEIKVFCNTIPGFERQHYLFSRNKLKLRKKMAYITTNPTDHEGPMVAFANRKGINPFDDYCQGSLMTGLFCGNGWYTRHPMLFDDIRHDILRAIEVIVDDPVRAAVDLKDYNAVSGDRFMDFSNRRLRHDSLVQTLEDISIRDQIYCSDLRISWNQIAKGAALRPRFTAAGDQDIKDERQSPASLFHQGLLAAQTPERRNRILDRFASVYFAADVLASATDAFDKDVIRPPGEADRIFGGAAAERQIIDIERTAGLPRFARRSIQNYREFASTVYAQDSRPRSTTGHYDFKAEAYLYLVFLGMAVFCAAVVIWRGHFIAVSLANIDVPMQPNAVDILDFVLSSMSLLFIGLSYFMQFTKQVIPMLVGNVVMTCVVALDLMVMYLKTIAWSFSDLKPFPVLAIGDRLALIMFCSSSFIIISGAALIAARNRIARIWGALLIRYKEWRVVQMVKRTKIPGL